MTTITKERLKELVQNNMIVTHTLTNGATIMPISLHGFTFSDGTTCQGQIPEVVNSLNLKRECKLKKTIKGMDVNEISMVLSEEQEEILLELMELVDLVIAPFPVLVSLRESGKRPLFCRIVAFNATSETMRLAPSEKIVDITNWSW
jgi:uncharacterized spore protein YtfJ